MESGGGLFDGWRVVVGCSSGDGARDGAMVSNDNSFYMYM
jgi:hypothetical protein